MKTKRTIDGIIWKTGHSYVITIPIRIINRLKLEVGSKVEIELISDDKIKDGRKHNK